MHNSDTNQHQNRGLLLVGIVVLLVALFFFLRGLLNNLSNQESEAQDNVDTLDNELLQFSEPEALPTPTVAPTPAPVVVYITGEIANPNVYQMPADARVVDVVQAAGGFLPEADSEQVNLAAHIQDEQHIHIPRVGEAVVPDTAPDDEAGNSDATAGSSQPININTATLAELDLLPNIGEAMAQRIIDYRTTNGPFATPEDLQNVRGIGPALFEDLRPLIDVTGS